MNEWKKVLTIIEHDQYYTNIDIFLAQYTHIMFTEKHNGNKQNILYILLDNILIHTLNADW